MGMGTAFLYKQSRLRSRLFLVSAEYELQSITCCLLPTCFLLLPVACYFVYFAGLSRLLTWGTIVIDAAKLATGEG